MGGATRGSTTVWKNTLLLTASVTSELSLPAAEARQTRARPRTLHNVIQRGFIVHVYIVSDTV